LAQYAGLSVRTLRTLLSRGEHALPHYRMAGKILVKRSEFDRWMQEYRREAPSRVDAIVDEVLKGL
jgi:excisionase family DNA binding protein